MTIDDRVRELGRRGPVAGDRMVRGKVGADLTLEQGRDAVFGTGRHTRSAVGLAELPVGIAVEIELVARLRPEAATSQGVTVALVVPPRPPHPHRRRR